jgi:hypothetical protein
VEQQPGALNARSLVSRRLEEQTTRDKSACVRACESVRGLAALASSALDFSGKGRNVGGGLPFELLTEGADFMLPQVEVNHSSEFDGMLVHEIHAKMVGVVTHGIPWWNAITVEDKAEIEAIFREAWEKAAQVCEAIKARPIDRANMPKPPPLLPSPNPRLNGSKGEADAQI